MFISEVGTDISSALDNVIEHLKDKRKYGNFRHAQQVAILISDGKELLRFSVKLLHNKIHPYYSFKDECLRTLCLLMYLTETLRVTNL